MSKKVVKYDNNKKYLGNIAVSEIVRDSSLIRFHYNVDSIAYEPDGETFDGTDFSGVEIDTLEGNGGGFVSWATDLNDYNSFLLVSCPSDPTKCGIYLITASNTCVKQDITFALGDLVSCTFNGNVGSYSNTIWQYTDTNKFIPLIEEKDYKAATSGLISLLTTQIYINALELNFGGIVQNQMIEYDLVVSLFPTPAYPYANQFLAYQFETEGIDDTNSDVYVNSFVSGEYNTAVKSDTSTVSDYKLTTERAIDPAFVQPRLNFIKIQVYIQELLPDTSGDPMKIKLKLRCGGVTGVGLNGLFWASVKRKQFNNFNSINY